MKKKSLLTVLAATTAFSGVAVVSQPSDAEAASSAKNQVTKAEKLAQTLAKQYPNAKLYNETKAAYNKALAAVKKAKGNERKVLQVRLSQKVKPTLDRTAKYISAVNAGKKLLTASFALDKNVNAYKLDSKTKKSYEALSADYKKLDKQISSVYGSTTRNSLKKAYLNKVAPTYNKAKFAFSFKSNTDSLAKAIKEGNYTKAKSYKNSVDKLIADNKKYKYSNVTTTLYKKLIAAYSPLSSQVNKMITTYTATSKDASNPTQFGGTADKPVTINHDVVIVAGKDKYIKLQNVVVNGNVIIKGDATGAGTVTLDHVKVNGTKTIGGQIIVEDVAEHSLYLINVQANSVVVNDANGSNIVAQGGTQVGDLIVSKKAGENGTITLEAATKNVFGKVTLLVDGNSASNGIVIKGDFSNVTIVVVGEGQKIIVPAGTVIGEIQKDPSVKGAVNIDNKGTIEKAEEGITVTGNQPVEVVKPAPVTPPGGGGGVITKAPTVQSATYTLDTNPIPVTFDSASGGYTIAGSISDIKKLTNVSFKIKAASDVTITASDKILGGITGGLTLSPDKDGSVTFNLNSNQNYVNALNSVKNWLTILSDNNGKIDIDVARAKDLLSRLDPAKTPASQTTITLDVQEVKSIFSDVTLAESIPNGNGSITVNRTKASALYAGLKILTDNVTTTTKSIDVTTLRSLLPLVGLPVDLNDLSRTITFKIADKDNRSVDVPVTIKVTTP